ncbi:MAG: GlcG/HbpS family heme-binding protein [Candidatus Methylumidiphilus sp.]
MNKHTITKTAATLALAMGSAAAMAQGLDDCPNISFTQLQTALKASVQPSGGPSNGGLDFNMWATVVGKDGTVCWVAKTGNGLNDQWLISRVISAQKANTAAGLSTNTFALSTANLYTAVQPGGTLFGLQHSNPVDTAAAYSGNSNNFGTSLDPLRARKIGGVNVFGGGLALYAGGKLVGGIGVSGDTSCADHNVAWRTREALGFGKAQVPAGVAGAAKDNILYIGSSSTGFEHPVCSAASKAISDGF